MRTLLRSVRTAMTSGLYSPVRLSRLISKKLVFVVYSQGEEEEESQKRHYPSPPLHKRFDKGLLHTDF